MQQIVFWKDKEKGIVDPALYSEIAEELAKEMKKEHETEKKKPNKPTQIRRFYDEVTRLNMEARARPGEWDNVIPIVHMLIAKAAYAQGRELVGKTFVDFIRSSVGQVKEPKDLSLFANIFEAFMGFYKLYVPKD